MNEKELKQFWCRVTEIAHTPNYDCRKGEMVIEYLDKVGYQINKKPDPWNGKGVPPVGTWCQARWLVPPDGGQPEWVKGTFKGVYDGLAWFGCYEEVISHVHNFEFRPIITEEEKLIDQLIKDVRREGDESDYRSDEVLIAKQLIAAGWRPNNQ